MLGPLQLDVMNFDGIFFYLKHHQEKMFYVQWPINKIELNLSFAAYMGLNLYPVLCNKTQHIN